MTPESVHGTGIVLDGLGVLIIGPSGAGKSLLALELMAAAENAGQVGALVADDQIVLGAGNNGPIMGAPIALEGKIELRGRGIVNRAFIKSAPLHLVIELVGEFERMPEAEAFFTQIGAFSIARCPVPQRGLIDSAHQILLVHEAMRDLKAAP